MSRFKYLQNIRWVGDLSLQDADVLAKYGSNSEVVFEHGSGGSTMIFAQTSKQVFAYEHNPQWVSTVSERIKQLNFQNAIISSDLKGIVKQISEIDVAFIDGLVPARHKIARIIWSKLKNGGFMLFHDSREFDPRNKKHTQTSRYKNDLPALTYLITSEFRGEIENISFNVSASDGEKSNINVIQKNKQPFYVDWQEIEKRPSWCYGTDQNVLNKFYEQE
jgi:predicted O-methyltransferase YrrM